MGVLAESMNCKGVRTLGRGRQRNAVIDMVRIIFSMIILGYHFYGNGKKHFLGGYMGVEVFCVLAGFLFFREYDQKRVAELEMDQRFIYLKAHTGKRFWRFFGYSFIGYIMVFVVRYVWTNYNIISAKAFFDVMVRDIWELLLVTMGGFNQNSVTANKVIWTVSSMFLMEFFILGLLAIYEKKYLYFWMPASVLCMCGWDINDRQGSQYIFQGLTTVGNIRVYIAMCFGIGSYFLYKKLASLEFRRFGAILLTIAEGLCYAWCIYTTFRAGGGGLWLFCLCLAAGIAIAITFSEKSYSSIFAKGNKMTDQFGEFSLCIYIVQASVLEYFMRTYGHENALWERKFEFLGVTILVTFIYMLFVKGIYSSAPKIIGKIKDSVVKT